MGWVLWCHKSLAQMALYLDTPERRKVGETLRWTAHLVSDVSEEELHAFAQTLGLPQRAFHAKPGRPHYDVLDQWIGRAVSLGATAVVPRTLVLFLQRRFGS